MTRKTISNRLMTVSAALCIAVCSACSGGSDSKSADASSPSPIPTAIQDAASESSLATASSTDSDLGATPKEERANAAALIARAEDLYQGADAIVSSTEKTSTGASDFYDTEGQFKDDLNRRPYNTIIDSRARAATTHLVHAETFLYSAVSDSAGSCNAHDARIDMKVAVADIEEARKTLNGADDSNWMPPSVANEVTNQNLCEASE